MDKMVTTGEPGKHLKKTLTYPNRGRSKKEALK